MAGAPTGAPAFGYTKRGAPMARFTSKPASIEAMQYTGELTDLLKFGASAQGDNDNAQLWVAKSNAFCDLPIGHWVMKEPDGSGFYPCDPAIFEARWEPESQDDDGSEEQADIPLPGGIDVVEVYNDGSDEQSWRWRKWSGGNHKKIASSGEGFVNESGAIQAAMRANPGATVRVNNGG